MAGAGLLAVVRRVFRRRGQDLKARVGGARRSRGGGDRRAREVGAHRQRPRSSRPLKARWFAPAPAVRVSVPSDRSAVQRPWRSNAASFQSARGGRQPRARACVRRRARNFSRVAAVAATHPRPLSFRPASFCSIAIATVPGAERTSPIVVPAGDLALLFSVFARAVSAVGPFPTANAAGENVRWEMLAQARRR